MSMSLRTMLSICLFTSLLFAGSGIIAQSSVDREQQLVRRFQTLADTSEWSWSDEVATTEYCIRRAMEDGHYHVAIVYANTRGTTWQTVRICDEKDALLYELPANRQPIFEIADDKLYYADYEMSTDGCTVVAVDLRTKTEVWRTHLRGIGAISHSGYNNRVTLQANESVVAVQGREMERYVEYLDALTGRTIAHRIFSVQYDGMELIIAMERTEYAAGDTLHFTAIVKNEAQHRGIQYTLDHATRLYLIEPNGSELVMLQKEKWSRN